MKLLKDILYKVDLKQIMGDTNLAIPHICFDSREVQKDSLFVAIKGSIVDGHSYIEQAINDGAISIVCEDWPKTFVPNVSYIQVRNSGEALGVISSNYYNNPSESIQLVGVTGTNGKTTVVSLLHKLFQALGYNAGLISTVVYKQGTKTITSSHTTPNAIRLNAMLREMVDSGCKYCFMEVSSHAIDQGRITGLDFNLALYTNISRDHLDYHKTFDEYIRVKKSFFDRLSSSAMAIVNADDKHGATMVHHTKAKHKTFALRSVADYKCKIIENEFSGLHLILDGKEVYTKLIGSFNASNLLLTYATAIELGEDPVQVLTVLSALNAVDGRFQQIKSDNSTLGIIDYAHTPDALLNVLKTISDIRYGKEKIICVVGCGGDRDKGKRPLMANIACQWADKVILTSDNPRSEKPESIIDDMKSGMNKKHLNDVLSVPDRKEAIKLAVALSQPGDVVLVAGKGHEKYQEINGERYDFDDYQVLNELLNS